MSRHVVSPGSYPTQPAFVLVAPGGPD